MLKKYTSSYNQDKATEKQLECIGNLGFAPPTELTAKEARNIIKDGFSTQPIGPIQRKNLLSVVTGLEEIEKILQKKILYFTDITISDYQRILAVKGIKGALFLSSSNHPIAVRSGYEYGWQDSPVCKDGKFYYLVSYDIAMFDIDDVGSKNQETILQEMRAVCTKHNISTRVYKTYNGYHIFVTSMRLHHTESRELMEILSDSFGSDIYYKVFCQKFGYKVRLNKKIRDGDRVDIVGDYVCMLGDIVEDKSILSYLELHDMLIKHHSKSDDDYTGVV